MKKTLFLLCSLAVFTAHSLFSQVSFSASPASQGPIVAGNSFNVQIQLSITGATPMNVQGFDLILETAAANSGFFSLTNASGAAPGVATSIRTYPDAITTGNSNHSGFAQNNFSQGFSFDTVLATAPFSNVTLETLTILVAPGTPAGTYTFFTTDFAGSANRSSKISDSNGMTYGDAANEPITQGSFSITVVPEPTTWAFMSLGGLGLLAINRLRAKRS